MSVEPESAPQEPVEIVKQSWWHHPQARLVMAAAMVAVLLGLLVASSNIRARREVRTAQLRMVDALAGASVSLFIDNNPARASRWCESVRKEGAFERVTLIDRDGKTLGSAGPGNADFPSDLKAAPKAEVREDSGRDIYTRQVFLAGDNQLGEIRIVARD